MRTVESSRWWEELSALAVDGFTYLDYLTAIDRGTHLDLVAHVVNPDTVEHLLVVAALPGDSAVVDSLVPLHAGANWHEREAAEMFGITFTGHPDPRRLLLRDESAAPPLRKSTPLPARVDTPWPGAATAGGDDAAGRRARRQLPPGVPAQWVAEGP
ncbi:MAG: NADH-quinone oxidoreductase subunit C [Actinobacteria bacterium]|nr:NADH-quinone oxidoreductase subunit C [Actinomycetota bacterium]